MRVRGRITEISEDRARVSMTLEVNGNVCATGEGLFIAVKKGILHSTDGIDVLGIL